MLSDCTESALLVLVYDECLAVCDDAIKQEDACPEFCDFVNHLYNHDPTIFQTLTTHYRQDIDVIVSLTLIFSIVN